MIPIRHARIFPRKFEMGNFDSLFGGGNKKPFDGLHGIIETGRNKNTGGHDHRTNKGDDRTPAQKQGDKSRPKSN